MADRTGEAVMRMHEVEHGTHHLDAEDFSAGGVQVSVQVDTLDNYWRKQGGGAIEMVKIDAEGFDPKVIAGMGGLLAAAAIDLIQFEYGSLYIRSRSFLYDVVELGARYGYRLGILHRRGVETLKQWHFDLERFTGSNMFADSSTHTRLAQPGRDAL